MTTTTSLIRLKRLLIVGAVVAGAVVPAAQAVGRPPDVQDTASANLAAQISVPPDVRDAATGTFAVPDAIDRYVATHQLGTELSFASSADVLQPPDVRDTAVNLAKSSFVDTAAVSRPPDISDAALSVQYGGSFQSTSSFNWGDWAIGIGSGLGLALALGVCLLMGRQLRHRVQTA